MRQTFPNLATVLRINSSLGIVLEGYGLKKSQLGESSPQSLEYYFADSSTSAIIEHNFKWAAGERLRPIFQFAYIMLPTPCNQACKGCFMGQDKKKLPRRLKGPYFSIGELSEILLFLKKHGAKAIVYGGGGELFAWQGAFDFIQMVHSFDLKMVIFTNGTLLSKDDVVRLNDLGVVLIVSLRDTVETYHNSIVGSRGFVATLSTVEYALAEGMHLDNRLAVEIPVTKDNERRVLDEFLPAMRYLNIVPMIEEYIQISVSEEERAFSHNFRQAKRFFEKACARDAEIGIRWMPELGTRMVGQPRCRRPLYSLAIFPSRDVMDCPSHSICYGNLKRDSLEKIVYSDTFKKAILEFELCACSVFYTDSNWELYNKTLPTYLEALK
ncbi:MAG: radical SAM protein [Deltaproteobacteria bacterium]|nr:radical SAM protein [Deltaproteobacteria bacterium]